MDKQAPIELRATVTGSSGRLFTMTIRSTVETWSTARNATAPLAVREQAQAKVMEQIIEQAQHLGIHERLAWPQVVFYEPMA